MTNHLTSLLIVTPSSVTALTELYAVKLALLTILTLMIVEWMPAGWRRRRALLLCAVAMVIELLGTASVLALA